MTKSANAAIFYNQESYSTSGAKLMGKGSANENFLKAFVRYSSFNDYYCYAHARSGFNGFNEFVGAVAKESGRKGISQRWISPDRQNQLEEVGCFYIPAPQIAKHAWSRRRYDQRSYSLCGLTHTISSQGVMGLFEDTIIAPTQEWDAIICTSQVVRNSIEHIFDNYTDYMAQRFGGQQMDIKLQLPVIPLGVDCDYYIADKKKQARAQSLRRQLGIGENDVVFLFVGRLSMHAKAHPAPMYLALEEAAKRTGQKVHLIESGWFDNDGQKSAFTDGQKAMAPSINHHIIDGRVPEIRDIIYHVCDVFTSLSDNIQETFGLTPLEAMAASKPVVVTDWNGYRDTVRDGIDGITIPTLTPEAGRGFDIAMRFEEEIDTYDHYIGGACQVTSVDVAKCANAYEALINDRDLRLKMGAAGRKRSEEIYDWRHIIGRYQSLWAQLGEIRNASPIESCKLLKKRPSNPLYDDPFAIFESYPTAQIQDSDIVKLTKDATQQKFDDLLKLSLNSFCMNISKSDLQAIFTHIDGGGEVFVYEIAESFNADKRELIVRYIIWFAKVGLVSIGEHNI